LIEVTLDAESNSSPPSRDVLQLILDLVIGSAENFKTARDNEAALAFTTNLPYLMKACQLDESNSPIQFCKLIVSLRALTSLVQDRDMKRDPNVVTSLEEELDAAGPSDRITKDKTDPR
jgi:hypothetical protein